MYRDHNCGELTIKNVGENSNNSWLGTKIRNLGSNT